MKSNSSDNGSWLKRVTLLIPLLAVAIIAPLSACSKSSREGGPLVTHERPFYRQHNTGLFDELAELDSEKAKKYKQTGSAALEKEAERRYRKGRRMDEVGIGRPGMSNQEYKKRRKESDKELKKSR